ncbi:DUF3391 domain-containing protein [Marinobacter salinexigens]|uniref:DUF3391 domain-containing protein n=1 Tax=Marinobacter salinexigens TaxID=2919747 RepID=A0A5B0VIN7_9GAMM|nr:HD-GYP domain-containing protein [Marinobacter salinexigens]KAA1173851.1 DUF3391 domain-containing protein [Marinobacter salinexigens]
MGVQQKKVAVHDLEVGMFVSDLDRPWHQTPFPIQGFHIRSQDDIRAVSSHCRWVMVDVAEIRESLELSDAKPVVFGRNAKSRGRGRDVLQLPPISIREPLVYEEVTSFRKEIRTSRQLLGDVEASLHRLFETIRSEGVADLKPIARLTSQMVSSVVRQPDALLWLARTRQHDDFLYRHALNTAVWALVCGRQLGLNEGLLNHLCVGCLLSQVGKTELSQDMLAREGQLDQEEFAEYKTYVARGVAKLSGTGLSRAVLSVIQGHRERHNGSGFPEGVRGDRIPLLAKIAGLAEFFESLVGPRDGGEPVTPARAVTMLYDMRNIEFQEDLIEVFIQAIGIYPTGSLVELTDGQRGIVISHSRERRLWPRVMVMTDTDRKPLKSAKIVDLARFNEERDAAEAVTVRECLPHGSEGLNPAGYDVTGVDSRWNFSRLISG